MSKSQAYNVQHGTTVSDNVSHIWKLLGERFSLQEKESWLYLVTDVNYTLSWSLYTNIKLLCCTPETHMLYVNYISENKRK